MKAKGISIFAIKTIYAIVIFILFIILFTAIFNQGNADMTTTMSEATLPTANMIFEGQRTNLLHGYTEKMDTVGLEPGITPVGDDRKVSFIIDKYGFGISEIYYEVRNMKGDRLIENTKVLNYIEHDDLIEADVKLKDLIDENEKYSFCLVVKGTDLTQVRFYTEIIKMDTAYAKDTLSFAEYFSETSLNRELAKEELVKYMEPNDKGDNSSFNYVDIHSSMNQLTWGGLDVSAVSGFDKKLVYIDENVGVCNVEYNIKINQDDKDCYYRVSDKYRIKLGSDRVYLLEFYRNTTQVFSISTAVMANNKIVLGINDENINCIESNDGSYFVFEVNKRLYAYNLAENKLSYIFGFYDDSKVTDARDSFDQNGIKIFSVDETGNIYFMVYGYMNRGIHEGQMGAVIYYYDSVINNVEEKVFIPYNRGFQILEKEIERLSYVSQSAKGYVFINDTLYCIDLNEVSANVVVKNVTGKGMAVSKSGETAAWISGGDINNATQIVMLNMITGNETYIQAEDDERIRVLGFFGNDLIMGSARKEDIDLSGDDDGIFPMYKIIIRDEPGNVLKEYREDGYYITDTSLSDTMLSLTRVTKTAGGYSEATDDQILNNKTAEQYKNTIEPAITENYEKIIEISLKNEIDTKSIKILTPKQVLFEGNRDVYIDEISDSPCYYVYSMGELKKIPEDSNEAIELAYENNGWVIDDDGEYVYLKTVYPVKNQIMAIKEAALENGESREASRTVCLNTVLKYEGINVGTGNMVNGGRSIEEILTEKLPKRRILSLKGCNVNTYMYYLAKDHPIIVVFKDNTGIIITGYNETKFVCLDPIKGTLEKENIDEVSKRIVKEGKCIFTYE